MNIKDAQDIIHYPLEDRACYKYYITRVHPIYAAPDTHNFTEALVTCLWCLSHRWRANGIWL